MNLFSRQTLAQFGLLVGLAHTSLAQPRLIQNYLAEGRIAQAHAAVEAALREFPQRDELRFQLALVQFLGALEQYSQSMYRFGLCDSRFGDLIPFLRFPVDVNPKAEPVTNIQLRQALADLLQGLNQTSATLASIEDPSALKVPLRLGQIRLDLNGDGVASPEETLWRVFARLNRITIKESVARRFGLHLDVADVRWLEGYCHLLAALAETTLAYDTQRLFDHTAHLFFARPVMPFPFLHQTSSFSSIAEFSDLIAFIHLIDLPVQEPARMQSALLHLEQVIALSRRSWRCLLAETDDDFEWIPNPGQRGLGPEWQVTQEQVKLWHEFLDESERILAGTTLLPFWRPNQPAKGINLRRVFTQPTRLDAVLWLQGTAATPYLEEGTITSTQFWERLSRAFRGNFRGFAAWFN